jgi:peptide-methionine (S)-S-oxide reductase
MENKLTTATLAGGCFWCTEAIFQKLLGIQSVIPGYAGGSAENPTYEQVSKGGTGHAEAIQIVFDSAEITFDKILDIFWHTHDPTTLNRQGNDIGSQYRSMVFYHDLNQKQIAENMKLSLDQKKEFVDPIVTEIVPFTNFYKAEDYHQNYYTRNKNQPYCSLVISPKINYLMAKYKL